MCLVTAEPEELFTTDWLWVPPFHSVDAFQVNWAASGASTRALRASSNAWTLTPLLTGVSVVVIFFLLIWSVLEQQDASRIFSMTLGSLTSLRANDVARHNYPRARTDAHAPGRAVLDVVHSCHGSAFGCRRALRQFEQRTVEASKEQHGESPPYCSSEPAALLEPGIEEQANPGHHQQCRRIAPDSTDLGHVLEVHPPDPGEQSGMAAMAT